MYIYIFLFDDLSMYIFVLCQKNIISTSTLKDIIAVCKKPTPATCPLSYVTLKENMHRMNYT